MKPTNLVTRTDYYPFGMIMDGRNEASGEHRYGYNGKENDNEVKGEGNQQDYGFRIYDSRVARFLSVDPLAVDYPWYTPYQFAGNTPIRFVDLDGLEPADPMGYVKRELEGAFIGLGAWIDSGIGYAKSILVKTDVVSTSNNRTQVTASTSVKTKEVSSFNFRDIFRTIVQSDGVKVKDLPPLVVTQTTITKTTVSATGSVEIGNVVKLNHTLEVSTDGEKTATTEVTVSSKAKRRVPVVGSIQSSVSSSGSTETTAKVGLGTDRNNVGVTVGSERSSDGTTFKVGLTGTATVEKTTIETEHSLQTKKK